MTPARAQLLRKAMGRATWMTKRKLASRALAAAERFNDRLYVGLEYRTSAANGPRYGHGRPAHQQLDEILRRNDEVYREALETIMRHAGDLRRIDRHAGEPAEPSWINDMLPALDSAAIDAFLRERRPRHYVEIGSGNSTKFAARARRDGRLATELISIDPRPRSEIDGLCDRVIRSPLECTDLEIFTELEASDVIFFDGSHRVFMNSDVTVFFLDILPRLAPGILVGVHDVYLPEDYPPEIGGRYYSEQYMLACWLLAGDRMEPILPAAYVHRRDLRGALSGLWHAPELEGVEHHGATFWWRVARAPVRLPVQGAGSRQ
jgi:predicted O-methyltransferase YrrM